MGTDRHVVLVTLAGLLGACASSSPSSDLKRVQELSRPVVLAPVAVGNIDPATDPEARRLLQKPLAAETAVRVALLNNRELRATLREIGVDRGRLVQAGLLPNPVIEIERLPEQDTDLELTLEYDLTQAILAPLRARAAAAEVEAARYRAAAAVVEVGVRARAAFVAVLASQQRLLVAQRSLDAFAAARDAARALTEAGNVPTAELASQEVGYERARIGVVALELEVVERREEMNRLLGLHGPETTWTLEGALEPAPDTSDVPADLESRAVAASLDLAATRHRLDAIARRSGLSRAQGWVPDVSVDVHGLYGRQSEGAERGPNTWRYGAGLAVGVPLFDRQQGTTTALGAEFDALLERYHGAAIDLRSAAREARSRLMSAHARARHYAQVILPAQRNLTRQTLLQYNAMQIGVFQLLLARREELDGELAYLETLREYFTARAALDGLLAGGRPATALQRPSMTPMSSGTTTGAGH